MVYKVSLVDSRDTLCDYRFDAEVHRVDGRMFTGRSLAIVFAADDDALSHRLCACRKLRIITVVAVLGHQRNIGAHAGEFRAGRGDIIRRDVVTPL